MKQTTLVTRLALMLVMVGALALAGCGGSDNGGLSASDMARLDAAEKDAAAAKAEAEQAKQDAADAQAAADAAKMAADVDAVWEALFMPAVEDQFKMSVGDKPTLRNITDAIIALAAQYGAGIPGGNTPTLESKTSTYFANAVPSPSTALMYFKMLRATDGFLPANRERAIGAVRAEAAKEAMAEQDKTDAKAKTDAERMKAEAAEAARIAAIVTKTLEDADIIDTQEEKDQKAQDVAAEQTDAERKAAEAAEAARIAAIVTAVLQSEGVDLIDTPEEKAKKGETERKAAEAAAKVRQDAARIATVYEGLAGISIKADYEARLSSSMTRDQVTDAIVATINAYSLMVLDDNGMKVMDVPTTAINELQVFVKAAVEAQTGTVTQNIRLAVSKAIFAEMRTSGTLTATAKSVDAHYAGVTPDPTPADPKTADMTEVAYIDTILGMDVDGVFTEASGSDLGKVSTFGTEHFSHTGGIVKDSVDDAQNGKGIMVFQANPGSSFADSGELMKLYGGWMKYGYFGSLRELASPDRFSAFSIGMETDGRDAIDGPNGGSASWEGTFIGHHSATASDADNTIMAGSMVSSDVELEVFFVKDKGAKGLVATFDDFSDKILGNLEIMIGSETDDLDMLVNIRRGASFKSVAGTTDVSGSGNVLANDSDLTGSIEGQFYGTAGVEVGGVASLINGGNAANNNATFNITGAFGAEDR